MTNDMISLMRLIQFTDSAFPIGTFSFSNGLETAIHEKLVYDSKTLEDYAHAASLQAAYSDGIVALKAYHAAREGNYKDIIDADKRLLEFKMNKESRLMLMRMGKKMAEMSIAIKSIPLMDQWLIDIKNNNTPGTYPVAQGILFANIDLSEEELFCSHQYGVINMIIGAALRTMRVSHYDTQQILYRLSELTQYYFQEIKTLELDDMNSFVPQIDIISSLHEKGTMRMFMN